MTNKIKVLRKHEIEVLLNNQEERIISVVKSAYETHQNGNSSLPHSSFLRFPDNHNNRIIALPAYLGGVFNVAGLKWIASFPENLKRGIERATAVIVLNSLESGIPVAILEGATVSAKRTAAGAALAAKYLYQRQPENFGIVGCGVINLEIVRFVSTIWPGLDTLHIYDLNESRSVAFRAKCLKNIGNIQFVHISKNIEPVLSACELISFATTAKQPYVSDITCCKKGSVILHVSLRDLSPDIVLSANNVVDDPEHVCREQTSIHLTEQIAQNRDFIRCSLGEILLNRPTDKKPQSKVTLFHPFGLGILDMAVAHLLLERAEEDDLGIDIDSFSGRTLIQ